MIELLLEWSMDLWMIADSVSHRRGRLARLTRTDWRREMERDFYSMDRETQWEIETIEWVCATCAADDDGDWWMVQLLYNVQYLKLIWSFDCDLPVQAAILKRWLIFDTVLRSSFDVLVVVLRPVHGLVRAVASAKEIMWCWLNSATAQKSYRWIVTYFGRGGLWG